MPRVSNEEKNLTRLAGEFLVASRLSQRGYMVALQWGTAIGYDILVFDKAGSVAYVEVKSSASNERRWILQKKYAKPTGDPIAVKRRFICCVDLTPTDREPDVYVFPALIVADALTYFYGGRFSKSASYVLPLDSKPRRHSKDAEAETVGEHINSGAFLERFNVLGVVPLKREL